MRQYHEHLKYILANGTKKPPERGQSNGTLSVFGYQDRYNLTEGFPILTTKKVNFRNIVVELLWFLKGDTNIKYLIDNDLHIWNEDAYNYYVKLCQSKDLPPMDFKTFVYMIMEGELEYPESEKFGIGYRLGDCGFQYGKVWRNFGITNTFDNNYGVDQISKLITKLKSSPNSRRHIVTAVDPANDENLALYWCHALFQFYTRELTVRQRGMFFDKEIHTVVDASSRSTEEWHKYFDEKGYPKYYLDCKLYQRSADMFLGVPYNISSYCLLIHIVAEMCNMIPGEFIHSFGDSHIYDNHREQVDLLLSRDYNKYNKPKLAINPQFYFNIMDTPDNVPALLEALEPDWFTLDNYESYPFIKADLDTGMKK